MNEPKYVFKTYDAELRKEETNKGISILKKVVWIIVGIIIVASIIFQENIFMGLSSTARVFLILLILYTFSMGSKTIWVRTPIELQFFDECLIIYRSNYLYNKKNTRREFNTIKYDKISKILFREESKRININGGVESTWYAIDAQGNVSDSPMYNKKEENGMQCIEGRFMENLEILEVLEKYTNTKVEIENG